MIQLNENIDFNNEIHDINITPFIDVMLVLLVILMIATPLTTIDVIMDLPNSSTAKQLQTEKYLYISVKSDKRIFIDNQLVTKNKFIQILDQKTNNNKEITIFFQADKDVNYAMLIAVMDDLRQAGYFKIGLVGLDASSN